MLETIKSSEEISTVFSEAKRIQTPFIMILVLKNEKHGCSGRVAFIAGKKLGNAVWRNAAKRRLRAVCKDVNMKWPGYDVVFIAKRGILEASYSKVVTLCKEALSGICR